MSDIYFKIHHGTRRLNETSLCIRCEWSHIYEDRRGEHVVCTQDARRSVEVHGKVFDCNRYMDADLPDKHDMEKIAWTLRTDRKGIAVGFAPPKKEEE